MRSAFVILFFFARPCKHGILQSFCATTAHKKFTGARATLPARANLVSLYRSLRQSRLNSIECDRWSLSMGCRQCCHPLTKRFRTFFFASNYSSDLEMPPATPNLRFTDPVHATTFFASSHITLSHRKRAAANLLRSARCVPRIVTSCWIRPTSTQGNCSPACSSRSCFELELHSHDYSYSSFLGIPDCSEDHSEASFRTFFHRSPWSARVQGACCCCSGLSFGFEMAPGSATSLLTTRLARTRNRP